MRTQGVAATLFPLLVLSGLALLAYWLNEVVTLPEQPDDEARRHTPDAIAKGITVYRYDSDGSLSYRLTSSHMEHYQDDDRNMIYVPQLVHYRPGSPDITLTAQSAQVTERGKRVVLRDDVIITRAAYANRPELVARTPELTALPEEGKVFNQHPVAITQGPSWLSGIGLAADNDLRTFTLRQQVRGRYVRLPPENPKTP
ncbi:MAG: LPS export ABC transporter periplasmic protein LptC [Zoogloeaceae bacterium]|jgi:lipopolysaccharide export system protein LptC|nr:LPS export ABC transporter periplasmic protein LptC [Zoogloeaceae bacterium]